MGRCRLKTSQILNDVIRLFFAPLFGAIKGAGSELQLVSGQIDERRQAQMSADVSSSHITPKGGNVFTDLGFETKEALELQAASRRTIAERVEMTRIQTDAPLSRDYRASIIERFDRDPDFAQALRDEVTALNNDGQEELARVIIELLDSRPKS